jgi:prepilin-type N-terminal cleavage/methylation domain-containing protein
MKRGYTVIELIMVIVIVGILAALAMPRFQSFYYIKFNGAMKKVIADIRYVQQLAVSRHESYNIIFDTASETYEVRRVSDNSYAINPFSRSNFIVDFNTDPQYKGINIVSADFGGGSSTLRFDWQGIPRNGADTPLSSEGSISFSYQGNTIVIYITPNTGRVK